MWQFLADCYPVGLLTEDELSFAGHGYPGYSNSSYLYTNRNLWSFSSHDFRDGFAVEFAWRAYSWGSHISDYFAVRPVVSLIPGTRRLSFSFISSTPLHLFGFIYPVGLLTEDELSFAGHGVHGYSASSYLYTGRNSWASSSYHFTSDAAREFIWLSASGGSNVYYSYAVRPVVSLVPGTGVIDDGERE